MANSDYVTLQDLSDNPYKTRHEVGPGTTLRGNNPINCSGSGSGKDRRGRVRASGRRGI